MAVDGKYGFIDQAGKMVIQPQYSNVEDFSQGLARVAVGYLEEGLRGVRVHSWPGWLLLWQSRLYPLAATDAPPKAPIWETNSLVLLDPECFAPPRFLKYQGPEPHKSGKVAPESSE